MPGPLPKAAVKKVGESLGRKALRHPISFYGKKKESQKAKQMPIIKGKGYKPPKKKQMPLQPRKKMTRDYKFIESESYQTRKRANKKRATLGMKSKPGRY